MSDRELAERAANLLVTTGGFSVGSSGTEYGIYHLNRWEWVGGGKFVRDPRVAMALMEQAADGRQRVLADPAPAARLMAFGDSGFELELRAWVVRPEQGVNNVRSEINLAIWRAFREHGISVPFPQREVRLLDGGTPGATPED